MNLESMEQDPGNQEQYPPPSRVVVVIPTHTGEDNRLFVYINALLTKEASVPFWKELKDEEDSPSVAKSLIESITEGLEGTYSPVAPTMPTFDVHSVVGRDLVALCVMVYEIKVENPNLYQERSGPFAWKDATVELMDALQNLRGTQEKNILYVALDELLRRYYTSDHHAQVEEWMDKMMPGFKGFRP